MSIEEREFRRVRAANYELLITAGLVVMFAALILVGIWVVSNTPQQYQIVAQGAFAATIILGFGQLLLILKAKLMHRDVSDDVDTTVKVADRVQQVQQTSQTTKELVNGGREREIAALQAEHERAVAALREELQRERHQLKGTVGVLSADNAHFAAENATLREANAKLEAQARELMEKLGRVAEAKAQPGPRGEQGERGEKGDRGDANC